jgi:hypothetical protein
LDEKLNASCGAWLAFDEASLFQGYDHLMDGRGGYAEVSAHIGLGGRTFEDPTVGVDEGQILALELCEARADRRRLFVNSLTHLRFIRFSTLKEARMNIKYRVELSQSEQDQLNALLSGGRHAARKLKRAQILLAAHADPPGGA